MTFIGDNIGYSGGKGTALSGQLFVDQVRNMVGGKALILDLGRDRFAQQLLR